MIDQFYQTSTFNQHHHTWDGTPNRNDSIGGLEVGEGQPDSFTKVNLWKIVICHRSYTMTKSEQTQHSYTTSTMS